MKEFFYTVTDPVGLHARPAGMLAKQAKQYESEIRLSIGERSADAKRLLALMGLGVKCGNEVKITVSGVDEERAAVELEQYFKESL